MAIAGGLVGGEVLAGLAVLGAEVSPNALGQGEGCFDGHFRCRFEEYLLDVSWDNGSDRVIFVSLWCPHQNNNMFGCKTTTHCHHC